MEIREPKFKAGDKVYCKQYESSAIITGVSDYSFNKDKYFYNVEWQCDDYLDEISEELLEPYIEKPKTVWDLKSGDDYYHIEIGHNQVNKLVWDCEKYDFNSRSMGNAFLTKEEAEFELERRKVETEMLRLGGRRHLKLHKENYCFCFDSQFSSISCECFSCLGICSSIYFDSEKEALKALNTIGEDKIKKYIFGVES